ncbi:hypothetical protein GPALN_003065 [Globodera pallida]|nr:hypothetical protein GPALN_003065 [Globodera pallida]
MIELSGTHEMSLIVPPGSLIEFPLYFSPFRPAAVGRRPIRGVVPPPTRRAEGGGKRVRLWTREDSDLSVLDRWLQWFRAVRSRSLSRGVRVTPAVVTPSGLFPAEGDVFLAPPRQERRGPSAIYRKLGGLSVEVTGFLLGGTGFNDCGTAFPRRVLRTRPWSPEGTSGLLTVSLFRTESVDQRAERSDWVLVGNEGGKVVGLSRDTVKREGNIIEICACVDFGVSVTGAPNFAEKRRKARANELVDWSGALGVKIVGQSSSIAVRWWVSRLFLLDYGLQRRPNLGESYRKIERQLLGLVRAYPADEPAGECDYAEGFLRAV